MTEEKIPYFVDPEDAPRLAQMPGLETTILTGLHGESMMMVLNATLPGHTVPLHTHPHEEVGMVYAGQAVLRMGTRNALFRRGSSIAYQPAFLTAIPASGMNRS